MMNRPCIGLLLCVTAACADARDATVVVRDSAGVRIVTGAAAPAAAPLQVDPLLTIGVIDGPAPYQFDGIRHVALTRDSGVVVLDGGSRELRRFDREGRHIWSAGGPGQGPGEFEAPVYIGTTPDGAHAIWDRRLARLTFIADSGVVTQTTSFASGDGAVPIAHRLFADSSLLVTYPTEVRPPPDGTIITDTLRYFRLASPDAQPTRIVAAPGAAWIWTGRLMLPVPFTGPPQVTIVGDDVATASGATPELRVFDATGALAALFRTDRASTPVAYGDIDELVSNWTEHRYYGASAEDWARWLGDMPVPTVRPAYDRLIATDDGHVWARRYQVISLPVPESTWDVFDESGAVSDVVTTPAGFEPTTVMGRLVAGIHFDDDEVQYVRVYRH